MAGRHLARLHCARDHDAKRLALRLRVRLSLETVRKEIIDLQSKETKIFLSGSLNLGDKQDDLTPSAVVFRFP
jgi:hypothetical protein